MIERKKIGTGGKKICVERNICRGARALGTIWTTLENYFLVQRAGHDFWCSNLDILYNFLVQNRDTGVVLTFEKSICY